MYFGSDTLKNQISKKKKSNNTQKNKLCIHIKENLITSERSKRSSYYQSYMGYFVDIQTALKPLKKIGKIEIKFYDYFSTS